MIMHDFFFDTNYQFDIGGDQSNYEIKELVIYWCEGCEADAKLNGYLVRVFFYFIIEIGIKFLIHYCKLQLYSVMTIFKTSYVYISSCDLRTRRLLSCFALFCTDVVVPYDFYAVC